MAGAEDIVLLGYFLLAAAQLNPLAKTAARLRGGARFDKFNALC